LNQQNISGHCRRCNAGLEYTPGAPTITCRYCGEQQPILVAEAAPAQAASSYQELLRAEFERAPRADVQTIRCGGCGAETTRPANVISDRCPFCASPALSAGGARLRAPDGVLPFQVDEARAREAIERWQRALWFKPGTLFTAAPPLHAVYLPYWSFDWDVTTDYLARPSKGAARPGRERTQVTGSTVLASRSVPVTAGADLEPWDLDQIVAPNPQLLLGVSAETHGELDGLARGAALSHRLLDREVDFKIRPGTGSNRPTIESRTTAYHGVRYRLLLLPVWTTSYLFQDRTYRVLVNARTGEVVGERPVSAGRVVRMFLAPFAIPLVVGTIAGASGGAMSFGFGLWGTLAAQSILILIIRSAEKAGPPRHGQFFLKREGVRGTENFGEVMGGLMQNDAPSRQELWRFFGFIGLFLTVGPLVSLGGYRNESFPFGMVVAFHVFSAICLLAVWYGYRENVKEKRALLGLDDPR
jgi:DNA-directed RNA polymerase subunit RPC12/RpoP